MEKVIKFLQEQISIFPFLKKPGKVFVLKIFKFLDHTRLLGERERRPHNFENTQDYLFIHEIYSAKKHIYVETVSFIVFIGLLFIGFVYSLSVLLGTSVFIIISGLIALFYFILMIFKVWIVYQSISAPLIDFSKKEIETIKDEELPVYTILVPLYREEKVIDQIIKAMTAIDYPKEKLDIIITLEEYDHQTISAIKEANPPSYFKTLILPNVSPKTKPKALNVAFLKTKGEFLVIYDAEIIPEPDQLKKAYLAFQKYPEIGCFQTRLDHYNADQNIITKIFNAEFSFYYDLFLPGLQKFNHPIPLSGHSTHFRKEVLEKIGAWDPYNVTEDCDVGIRLHRMSYRTGIINSISQEEAVSNLKVWIRQRTRWMKGFIQTSIVHLRYPFHFKDEIGGWKNFFVFLFIVPGTVVINILNFIYWIILILWLTTHAKIIQVFFPGFILYISVISFLIGNFIFTYLNLLGAYKRGRYNLIKYSLLSPFYWILLAIATVRAAIHIITKPHLWEKTTHGEHLKKGRHLLFKHD